MVSTTKEEVIGRTEDGRVIVYFECLGTDSYQSGVGGFEVSIGTLRAVERILELGNQGGYRTEPEECTITANKIKIPVRWYGYGCATACAIGWEVGYDVDLSATKFSGVVIGH